MRLYVYCEGDTERDFVKFILAPYLDNHGIDAIPVVCTTGYNKTRVFKGGVSSYSKIEKELSRLCKNHKNEYVTTMFDFYGFPKDFPGISKITIGDLEDEIAKNLNCSNLLVYLSRHEFEALLFSDVQAFEIINPDSVSELRKIREKYETPEDINNSESTAPSKRIIKVIGSYSKVLDGITVAKSIDIEKMMDECPHFNKWIQSILQWKITEES